MIEKDVVIIGAGVAGLSAAITLAKADKEVKVYEIGERPKPNFDIAVHALRNYGFEKGVLKKLSKTGIKLPKFHKIKKVFKFSPSLKSAEIISKDPIFYSFLRGKDKESIDQVLLRQAKKLGVDVITGKTVDEKEADIIATGARRVDGVAFGYYYENVNMENAVYTVYDNRYAPKGYFYVLPYKNSADIVTTAFCSPRNYPNMEKYFEDAMKKISFLKQITDGAEKISITKGHGNFGVPQSAIINGKLYVGEAAGFQDGSKGFGVKFAILSGYLAAKSIIENKNYDNLWKKEFQKDLIYYFKRRIAHQRMKNEDFEKIIAELGKKTTKEMEEKLKQKQNNILDKVYNYYLMKWRFRKS